MVNKIRERLEDIQKFETYKEKVEIYGEHLRERLQNKIPEIKLIGRTTPGFSYCVGVGEWVQGSTFYLIGEELSTPTMGLRRIFFGGTEKKLRILVKLNRDEDKCFARIHDVKLRDYAQEIMAELDGESGERYLSDTKYSAEEEFFNLRKLEMAF